MTLETLFEKFDQFADAPDAVATMRELVLDLAVKGKLTDRDLKKELVGLKYADEPSSGVLPANWRLLNFGKFCDIQGGNQPPKSQFSDEPRPGYVRMFQIRDLGERPVPVYISKESTNRFCREGEILIGRYGASVGKVFWAQNGAYNVALAKFIFPEDALLPAFAFWVLKSDFFQAEIAGASRSAQAGFNKGDLAAIDFPLPPLAEQKRIVAKVDELMVLCDRLEAQQQEREARHAALARASLARFADAPTPANLPFLFPPSYAIPPADLRKSILTLAVQGKLVPQDPNDEPAEEILAGIAGDVAKAIRAKRMRNSRPIPTYEDEFPFDLPAGWAWAPLGTLTAAEDGAMCDGPFGSKLKTEHYIPTKGYAVLRLGNIGVGYFIHGKEGHISREHFECLPSNHTAPGDLLVAGLADPLVRCCEIPPDIGPAVNKSDCFRVRLSKRMERSYVRHYLNSPIAKAFAAEENHGMTRERINLANAKALPVSLPPLAE